MSYWLQSHGPILTAHIAVNVDQGLDSLIPRQSICVLKNDADVSAMVTHCFRLLARAED